MVGLAVWGLSIGMAFSGLAARTGEPTQMAILHVENGLVLEWKAEIGSHCFLQHSPDLINWSWDTGFLLAGSGQITQHPVPGPESGNPVFYRMVVTDDYDSEPMQLDWAGDDFSVGWKLRYGLDPWVCLDPTRDLDGDGRSLLEEYQSGTHPLRRDHPDVGLLVMRGIL